MKTEKCCFCGRKYTKKRMREIKERRKKSTGVHVFDIDYGGWRELSKEEVENEQSS